jgi:GntR family transcriptional regulator/MocR family aminotransferase
VRALRGVIADYVRRSRSVRCDPDQIIITAGTQQGLYLASHVLVGPGDATWVENPAYPALTAILTTTGRGRGMIRVPVDDEGLDVENGRVLAPSAKAVFVTPSHQYPLGMPKIWLTLQAKCDLWHAMKARGNRPKIRPLRKTA